MNIFADNKNFYPTPEDIVKNMLDLMTIKEFSSIGTILEPSAGKGDIADAIKEKSDKLYSSYTNKTKEIDVIEIDSNLQSILKDKDYPLVFNDFLSYQTKKHYDLIMMNPPFDTGDEHLLKAITLSEANGGGTIIALLNAETLLNPYSNTRKLLINKLNDYSAEIRYMENAFAAAERQTAVRIAMIKVVVPAPAYKSFIFDKLEEAEQKKNERTTDEPSEIVSNDYLKQMITYYNKEVELTTAFVKEYLSIVPYISNNFVDKTESEFTQKVQREPFVVLRVEDSKIEDYADVEKVLKRIRYKYWKKLFYNKDFINLLTSKMQTNLWHRLDEMEKYEFNMFNINEIKKSFISGFLDNIDESICGLFKELSRQYTYYDCSKNIHYFNGWKSNKAHRVNTKCIIPMNGAFASSWSREYLDTYHIVSFISNLEKILEYLDLGESGYFTSVSNVTENANANEISRNIHYKYFDCTFYKKGTCHITFTNQDVLDKLNIYMSRKNNWLPPSYGKVSYDNLTQEEQTVINEFQGKEAYEKVCTNPQKYIIETNQMLTLPERAS